MSKLFSSSNIKNLKLKNKFVMAAANDNCDVKTRIDRFSKLAKGDVGLIISGGQSQDEILEWKDVVTAVHDNGGKIALQLVSNIGGRFSVDDDAIAVSKLDENHVFFDNPYIKYCKHHAATEEEIERIILSYGEAAKYAKSINVDAVEIHSAHHNFLSQFLSPLMNKREDKWGGSIENRSRIHKEIYNAIRAVVGGDLPIIIKLGVEDSLAGGLLFDEGKKIASLIYEYGYDAIEVSQGLQDLSDWATTPMRTSINNVSDEAYFRKWCSEIKTIVPIPIIMTGGLRSYGLIEEIINNNEADFIGLCRPLIREPALIKRWKTGDHAKASCISCNQCILQILMRGKPLECFIDMKKV
jgi:2,4-dienoyl-CoA reductase-like NADH-dependent reductase (Old Yellow Enzyme family)